MNLEEPRANEQPCKPDKALVIICDIVLVCALWIFSYAVFQMMPNFKRGLPKDVAFSPLTSFVLNNEYTAHLPLILTAVLTVCNLSGRLTHPRTWMPTFTACFVLFVLFATVWILGTTNPFWVIPVPLK